MAEDEFGFDLGSGGATDFSQFAGLDPSYFDLSGFSDASGGSGLFYDTMTGQYVTYDQAVALDPSFAGTGGATNLPTGGGVAGNGAGAAGGGGMNLNSIMRLLAGGAGLGAAGLGAAGIAQGLSGGDRQGPITTRTDSGSSTVSMPGPMSAEQNALLTQLGGAGYGGLQGMAGHGIVQNMAPSGLMNLQAGILGELYGNAPNADPYLQQQLSQQAYGMAGGNLPALSGGLQQQINDIYGSQWNNIDRYLEDYLGNVRDQMNNQGWEGGTYDVLRQGPGQAMFAPGIREATRQQGLLAGQAAQAGINLAQQLPMNALQLGGGVLQQGLSANQNQQNIASGFNTPIALRNQLPLGLFQSMNSARGTSSTTTPGSTTQTQQLPGMTLLDAFAPAASILGGLGGLAGGINQMGG